MVRILAIESSCDETAAAVVETGNVVLSNIIASQIRYTEFTAVLSRKLPAVIIWRRLPL